MRQIRKKIGNLKKTMKALDSIHDDERGELEATQQRKEKGRTTIRSRRKGKSELNDKA